MAQTILITGASSGIGKSTALLFQRKGWNVVATMRHPDKEDELHTLDNVLVAELDVTRPETIEGAVADAMDRFGAIDVLMNNAGFGVYGPLEAISSDQIRRQYHVNVIGLLDTTKALIPHFRTRKKGMIINISSVGGHITFPLGTLYHGTKFAVEGISEALSHEMREIGVTVKLVEPGDVLTTFKVERTNDDSLTEYHSIAQKFREGYAPIKAKGSPPELIADVIFEAATDGTDRLRYPAGWDAVKRISDRKFQDDETYIANMRQEFGLS